MDRSLIRSRNNEFKRNPIGYILLGIFFCLFAVGCVALDFVFDGLGVFAIVLLLFPLLFGVIFQSSGFQFDVPLSMKGVVRGSALYYSTQFFGSFRLLICLLKTLIVETIMDTILLVVLFFVFKNQYGQAFQDSINALFEAIMYETESETAILDAFAMNDNLLDNYRLLSASIASLFGSATFIFSVSFNSLGANFRMLLKTKHAAFAKNAVNQTMKNNRKGLVKDYFYLNWPLLALMIIGLVLGTICSIVIFESYLYILPFGLMGAFIMMIPYFPTYLANMNAIFKKYEMTIIMGINDSIKNTLKKIQSTLDLSEQDKGDIEEALKSLDEDNETDDEGNKKDPESGS